MTNMRFLWQSAAIFVLLCASVHGHEDGNIAETGHEAQGLVNAASEKLSNVAEAIKNIAKSGYDTVSAA